MPRRPSALAMAIAVATAHLAPSTVAMAAPGNASRGRKAPAVRVELAGELIDPEDTLLSALSLNEPVDPAALARLGRCAKRDATGGETRERRLLEQLGYCVDGIARSGGKAVVRLRRYPVIGRINISTGGLPFPLARPIFRTELERRLRFRAGQRLPQGKELAQAKQREQERMARFLQRRGFFSGATKIKVRPADERGRVQLDVNVVKGKSYKVGEVKIVRLTRAGRAASSPHEPIIAAEEVKKLFRENIPPSWCLPFRDLVKVTFTERLRPWQPTFDTEQFKENTEQLIKCYQRRGYPGVRIKASYRVDPKRDSDEAVQVTLKVRPRKQIEIHYQGNDHISDKELTKVLTLYESGSYDDYELNESARQIHARYQKDGYLQARVRATRESKKTKDVVTFHVVEGPEFRVKKVTFTGNHHISERDLRKVVRTSPYPWLGIGAGGYVTAKQLRQDAERIAALYRQRGFPSVQVHGEVAPDPRLLGRPGALAATLASNVSLEGKAYIRFTIKEGPQVRIDRVEIHGARAIPAREILKQLKLKRGEPFTPEALEQDKARIVRIYGERGYPYVRLQPLDDLDETGTRVGVQYSVLQEGKQVRFGPIFFRGNFNTHAFVIRNALPFKEGDVFDLRKLEQAERKLRALQLFSSVRLQLVGIDTDRPSRVPVIVRVEERYVGHGALELGIGASSDNSFFGSLAYTYHNFLGLGPTLQIRGEVGLRLQNGTLRFNYPRILGTPYTAELRLFGRREFTPRLGNIVTGGGTATVSRRFFNDLLTTFGYAFRVVALKQDLLRPTGIVDDDKQRGQLSRIGTVSASLTYDKRDNPLLPTRGYRLQTTGSVSSRYLGGTNDFLKLEINAQGFIPLPLDMLIAIGVRYGHGVPLHGDVLLPRVERYYAGGDTTIRGFNQDRAFAQRVVVPLSPSGGASYVRLVPQGGNIRLLTNIELQFPIWKDGKLLALIPWTDAFIFALPLMGAVFSDNGVVFNSYTSLRAHDFRHSMGGAVRLRTPVGFLSLEYAWPLDPDVGDSRNGRFHFNFGFIF